MTLKQIKGLTKASLTKLYTKGLTQRAIADRFGIDTDTVKIRLTRWGIPTRPQFQRKHHYMNLDRFSKISDRDSAYILGYIAWAGFSIGNDLDAYLISARATQKPCLDRLVNMLGVHDAVTLVHQGKYKRYMLRISKKGLNRFISKWYYGHPHITPFKFPPTMAKKFLPDYLRGYLDRHICFTTSTPNGKYTARQVFISTPYKSFTEQLISCLKEFNIDCWIKTRTQVNGKLSYGVHVSAYSFKTLYTLLYSNPENCGTHAEKILLEILNTPSQNTKVLKSFYR
jgi:hypothetical protein